MEDAGGHRQTKEDVLDVALASPVANDGDVQSRRIGEALWAVVALARAWDVDAETVLREITAQAVEMGRASQGP